MKQDSYIITRLNRVILYRHIRGKPLKHLRLRPERLEPIHVSVDRALGWLGVQANKQLRRAKPINFCGVRLERW